MAAAKWTNSIWPEHVLNSWLLSNSIMHSNNSVSCAWQFEFIWKLWWRGLNLCGNWQKSQNALTVLSRALRQWQVTSHKRTEFSVCFVFEKTTYMIASSSEKSRLGRCQESKNWLFLTSTTQTGGLEKRLLGDSLHTDKAAQFNFINRRFSRQSYNHSSPNRSYQ